MPDLLRLALEQLETLPPSIWLRRSGTLYLLVNAAHIGSIGLLIGSIVPLDLRLLGLIRPGPLAVLTGAMLLSVRPLEYLQNPAFLTKMGLLGAGALNAWAVRRGPAWARVLDQGKAGGVLRIQAGASLLLWLGCLVAGRWIGFL
jgi:hypothetical protein